MPLLLKLIIDAVLHTEIIHIIKNYIEKLFILPVYQICQTM